MTAVPVFLVRAFHHGAILANTKSGIPHPEGPRRQAGRRQPRLHGHHRGVGARHPREEYGVDLSKITWVLSGDEHVAEYRPPGNRGAIEPGKKMGDMLGRGRACRRHRDRGGFPPMCRPLIPDAFETGLAALRRRGLYRSTIRW